MKRGQSKREYLPSLMSKTRLSRIQAERRLIRYDLLTKRATVYYACWTVLFSLLSFCFPDFRLVSFLAIALAIMLTIATVFASMQDFGSRAIEMRLSYIEIQKLWLELDNASDDENADERADRISEAYVSILQRTENHEVLDFAKALDVKTDAKVGKDVTVSEGSGNETRHVARRTLGGYELEVFVYSLPLLLMVFVSTLYMVVEYACFRGV